MNNQCHCGCDCPTYCSVHDEQPEQDMSHDNAYPDDTLKKQEKHIISEQVQEWEKEFDGRFTHIVYIGLPVRIINEVQSASGIKDFIRKEKQKSSNEGYAKGYSEGVNNILKAIKN